MRMDHIDYALPLFHEEALVLTQYGRCAGCDAAGGMRLYQGLMMVQCCLRTASTPQPMSMTGTILRLGTDEVESFPRLAGSEGNRRLGALPGDREAGPGHSLLHFCDAGTTRGRFWPLTDLLRMSVQICDIIEAAHDRKIVYRDHKILHYYWLEDRNGVYMIDWNVARLHSEDLRDVEKQMDLTQFGASALHHILTGRTAPGALPLGPTRPEEIEAAATTYTPQWTYDDRRLPQNLKDVIERVLSVV
jgi:hypothetical protein